MSQRFDMLEASDWAHDLARGLYFKAMLEVLEGKAAVPIRVNRSHGTSWEDCSDRVRFFRALEVSLPRFLVDLNVAIYAKVAPDYDATSDDYFMGFARDVASLVARCVREFAEGKFRGDPTGLRALKQAEVESALHAGISKGLTVEEVAVSLGLPRSTVFRHRRKHQKSRA